MFYDRPKPGSWKINRAELDGAVATILKREHVDSTHDVPYTAGYSKDGKTLFLDRLLPRTLEYEGKKIEVRRYILLHEAVEKALIEELGLAYLHAHQIALRAERAAVEADGLEWNAYNSAVIKQVNTIGARKCYANCPKNLDLTPYRDEKDHATLRKMDTA